MNVYYLKYDGNGFMYDWQDINFIDELERNGHMIKKVSVKSDFHKLMLAEQVKIDLSTNQYDVFFTSCDDKVFSKELFFELKKVSIPTVLFCSDNLSVPFLHKKYCSSFDLVWLTSYQTVDMFKKWGANTVFLPYASNPYTYVPTAGKELPGVSFVGTLYGARLIKIKQLIKEGIPVNLYGGNSDLTEKSNPIVNFINNFKHASFMTFNLMLFDIGRMTIKGALLKCLSNPVSITDSDSDYFQRQKLSFGQLSDVYSRSMLSLGVSELWNTYLLKDPIHKIHLRSFEIPMSGGLQIVSRCEEFMEYYKEDEEIIFYENENELQSKCKFYLDKNKSTLREKMKKKARERSVKDHTWSNRFNIIFQKLNIGRSK